MQPHQPFGSCRAPDCRTRPTPGYADRGLCHHHETAGYDAVTALPGQWVALQPLVYTKPATGLAEALGRPKFGPADPLHLPTATLVDDITYTVTLWEVPVRDRARLCDPPTLGPAGDVARAALTLATHYTVLVALPPTDVYLHPDDPTSVAADGPDAVVALIELHRRAAATLGLTTATHTLPDPCHLCGWPQLRHRDGADTIFCPGCRTTWTWALYRQVTEAHLFGGVLSS